MKTEIAKLLFKAIKEEAKNQEVGVDLTEEKIINLIEIPPSVEMGDYAFPCFILSKYFKIAPQEVSILIRKNLPTKNFSDIQTAGPYINFFVDRNKSTLNLIKSILKQKEKFGGSDVGGGDKVLIEFSQPNTHKAFHVGHIRGTSIGESLSRISEFSKNKVIRANYSGDTGMHIAKWIWCYGKYHSREKLKNDESWIASVYVDAVKRLARNKKSQDEVNVINQKIENKSDKTINRIWAKTRKLSIESWKKIYQELNTKFDVHFFESEVEIPGREIALDLLKKGIAKKSEGAVIMDLREYDRGVWVLLRKDGTVLYSAKDIALAEKKYKKFLSDRYLVVVGDEQKFHFQQLVKTLEMMDVPFKDNYGFLPFGMIRFPTGKMSSRTGENVLYSTFIEEVKKLASKEVKKREPKIRRGELEKRSLGISIAAIKYSMLKQDPKKIIIFNPKESISFEGNTGPYLLYSYARASSILRKVKTKQMLRLGNLDEKELELIKSLSKFPEVVSNAYKNLNPSLIANYAYEISHLFNEFYHACPVANSKKEKFRIMLVESFRIVLKNSLNLLGIDTLEKM